MKKVFYLLMTALLPTMLWGQRLQISLKDKSILSYNIDDIDCMEVLPELQKGELFGNWFLGYRVLSSGTTNLNGTEYLRFSGNRVTWVKSNGETNYDVTYSDDMNTVTFTNQETGTNEVYNILANEDELLVLKRISTIRYFYKSVEAARNATMVKLPNRNPYTDWSKIWALKGGSSKSTKTPMGKHFENRHVTTDEDRAWLANALNQPTVKVGSFNKWVAKTVKLYPFGDPQPADINQHAIGDCCMCAVLAAFAYHYPDFIKNIITSPGSGRYTVKMYDPAGEPVDVTVDNKILCDNNSNVVQLTGKNNAITWGTIIEKAIMKWQSIYNCNGIEGIGTEHVAPLLTGCGESYSYSPGTLFNSEMKDVIDYVVENGLIGVGGFNVGDLDCGGLTTVTGHAFTLMHTTEPDKWLFSMRNPWGHAGDRDGVLEIPNKREVVQTIDFRLVFPGAAAPFKKENNTGGYVVPKFVRKSGDLGVAKRVLRMTSAENEEADETYGDE